MLYPVLGCLVGVYCVVVGTLYVVQRRLLYYPSPLRPYLADLAALGVREVELTTADGLSLFAWYLPPPAGRPVIAYFHGNRGHIGYRGERLRRFAREGLGVLLVEYRGYGGNPGAPSERGLFADGEAALDFLGRHEVARSSTVLWGVSLGSGVAVYLAARHRVGAVVLEAPFTSIGAAAQLHYRFVPAALMVRDRFDSISRIAQVKAPLLILHGERDRIVPASMGRALLAAATSPKEGWFAPEGRHGNLGQFGGLDVALSFIERRVDGIAAQAVAAGGNFD